MELEGSDSTLPCLRFLTGGREVVVMLNLSMCITVRHPPPTRLENCLSVLQF